MEGDEGGGEHEHHERPEAPLGRRLRQSSNEGPHVHCQFGGEGERRGGMTQRLSCKGRSNEKEKESATVIHTRKTRLCFCVCTFVRTNTDACRDTEHHFYTPGYLINAFPSAMHNL